MRAAQECVGAVAGRFFPVVGRLFAVALGRSPGVLSALGDAVFQKSRRLIVIRPRLALTVRLILVAGLLLVLPSKAIAILGAAIATLGSTIAILCGLVAIIGSKVADLRKRARRAFGLAGRTRSRLGRLATGGASRSNDHCLLSPASFDVCGRPR
ncbi:MAG: hypothetical protein ACXWZ8_07235 [Gaiellaceae bacterium]